MTQRSRPQPESTVTAATYLDSGPYSGDQWAQRCALSVTGDETTATERTALRGVVPTVWDKLCVTNPSLKFIDVDLGAAWVRGHLLVNDDVVRFDPSVADPGCVRQDRVVVVQNNTNAVYATNLEFPTVLADYNGLASVPAYCCRLAILTGDCGAGGAMRALVQTANYWMIELARYSINNAGAVSVLTDHRDFAQIEHVIGVHSDNDATIEDALIVGAEVDDAAGSATNFGVAIMARLEDSIGTMRDVARIAIRYWNNVFATLTSRFEFWLRRENTDVLAGVVVATDTVAGYLVGNARGGGAVDWQGYRTVVTQVASGRLSVVSGGQGNTASGAYATIGGGLTNQATGTDSTVGGGDTNLATVDHAVISGGIDNQATGIASTVSGGNTNLATGTECAVGGGDTNTAGANAHATIGGGRNNQATGAESTVGGGDANVASSLQATVGGGDTNTASGVACTVAGGDTNTAGVNSHATIGGGLSNQATGVRSTVGGGGTNVASGTDSVIGGGSGNTATAAHCTVGGGDTNQTTAAHCTVGGGEVNSAGANTHATTGGGFSNTANGQYATIAGGNDNTAGGTAVAIAGGETNTSNVAHGAIGGGRTNIASGVYGTVGGGELNTAGAGTHATVGGGYSNLASGDYATIAGGFDNTASGTRATVGGGQNNTASGDYVTVPGGIRGVADKYGQVAAANGRFAADGDAQGTIQMVVRRAIATHVDTTWYSLWLDGAAVQMTIAASTSWTVHVLVNGITQNSAQQWGYELIGLIERDNANVTTLAGFTLRTIFESDANYDAQLVADNVNEALEVQVRRNGGVDYNVRWTATVRTSETSYP